MKNKIVLQDLKYITSEKIPWKKLKGKTFFITGAAGFIPSYIVKTLLFLNHQHNFGIKIYALVRNPAKAKKAFSEYQELHDLVFIDSNLSEKIVLKEKIDFLIHAASQASPKFFGTDPVGTMLPNIIGTYHLLNLVKDKKIKCFLFISSGEVYGKFDRQDMPIKENQYGFLDPLTVRSCYGESKRAGETLCISYHHQYRIPVKIVRLFHTYGSGMDLEDGRVHADFVADVVSGRDIVIKGDERVRRSYCYVADTVKGIFTVLLKGKIGESYNIGNRNSETTIENLAKIITTISPMKGIKVIKKIRKAGKSYLTSELPRVIPDTSKIEDLGWNAKYSLNEGFKRTIESYSENL